MTSDLITTVFGVGGGGWECTGPAVTPGDFGEVAGAADFVDCEDAAVEELGLAGYAAVFVLAEGLYAAEVELCGEVGVARWGRSIRLICSSRKPIWSSMVLRQKMRSATLTLAKAARSRSDRRGLGDAEDADHFFQAPAGPWMKSMSRWVKPRVLMSQTKLAMAGRFGLATPRWRASQRL